MRIILIAIIFLVSTKSYSQERFFEFLPGWRNLTIIEKGNKYLSIGNTSDGIGLNHYQFSDLNLGGSILEEWEFDLDSVQNIGSLYTNDYSSGSTGNIVTGLLRGETSDRFYGTFIKFTDDFQETIRFNSFNILPGNGTQIRSHIAINSNKFILGGFLQNTDFQVYSSLMESDSLGNIAWRKNYFCGNDCELFPVHILQAADKGYFFTCSEVHFDNTLSVIAKKTAIIKTDSLGNEQYHLHPGQPDLYAIRGWVLPTDDGNYITAYSDPMLGVLDENPQVNPNETIWLYKFDLNGSVIFEISLQNELPLIPGFDIGYPYTIYQMIYSNDGNIIITGHVNLYGFLLKVSPSGDFKWVRFYSPPQSEGNDAGGEFTRVYGVTPTSDGGYIMAGEYFSSPGNIYPEGIQTAIAVKVDEFGCLVAGCDTIVGIAEIPKVDLGLRVYPNPASETINISVSENIKVERIRVYEVTGRVVLEKAINGLPLGEGGLRGIDVSHLKPGIVFARGGNGRWFSGS